MTVLLSWESSCHDSLHDIRDCLDCQRNNRFCAPEAKEIPVICSKLRAVKVGSVYSKGVCKCSCSRVSNLVQPMLIVCSPRLTCSIEASFVAPTQVIWLSLRFRLVRVVSVSKEEASAMAPVSPIMLVSQAQGGEYFIGKLAPSGPIWFQPSWSDFKVECSWSLAAKASTPRSLILLEAKCKLWSTEWAEKKSANCIILLSSIFSSLKSIVEATLGCKGGKAY